MRGNHLAYAATQGIITSVLSKVFERLVSVRLGRFMERNGVLPTAQFAYRKGLGFIGICDTHYLRKVH